MNLDRPLSRRAFVAAASGMATSAIVARGPRDSGSPGDLVVHVGTYTNDGHSKGVYVFRMDSATGALRSLGVTEAGPNPSFLALHPNRRALFAANEIEDYGGARSGAVSGFGIDSQSGALAMRDRRSSRGSAPCYVSVDHTGRFVFVANYVGGSIAVLPVRPDGGVGDATAVVQHAGKGPKPEQQDGPHAHCIIADPSNRHVLAADLGIDRIMVYRFDPQAGTLTPAATPFAALPPGAGPRHLAFHPSGRFLYVINELDLTVAAFGYDASTGGLAALQTLPLVPGLTPGTSAAADLHVAPSGRFLYGSVRGDNSIVVFALDGTAGTLTPVQRISTGGNWPRNFGLDPSGQFLFVANQRSGDLIGFRVDVGTGRLTPSGQRVEVPSPVCVLFGAG